MGTSLMTLVSLADVDKDAVCNDGSPAGYYIANGTGAGGAHMQRGVAGVSLHARMLRQPVCVHASRVRRLRC